MVSIRVSVKLPQEGVFTKKRWLDEIAREQRQTSVPRLKKLFQQTVYGWGKKPDFGWAQVRTNDAISIQMYPTGQYADLWELINEGSPPHTITPRKPRGFLRFRPGYRSATLPGQLQSRRAYRSGQFVGARIVHHPGFEARKFDQLIVEAYSNPYMTEMQEAINKAAKG